LTDLIGLRLAAFTLQIDLLFYPGFAKDVMACGELTRTFYSCAAFDGLETGMGVNFG
jgi:hypothetical protein